MTLPEYVAYKYKKPIDWASQFIDFATTMLRFDEILKVHCEASRDYWARKACSVASCSAPDYAYFRGKSDAYHDLAGQFLSFATDLDLEYQEFINNPTKEKEFSNPWT